MPYVTTICEACGAEFLCMRPEQYEMCEECEDAYQRAMSHAQDIDWHQEQNDLANG